MQMIFSNDWPTAARTAVRLLSPVQIWRIQHKVFFHLGTEPHCKMFFFKKSRFQIKGAFLENKTWAYMTMCFAVFHFDSMLCWRVVFHPPLISDSHKVPSSRTQPLRLLQLTQAGAVYSLQVCTQDYTLFWKITTVWRSPQLELQLTHAGVVSHSGIISGPVITP